MSKALLDHAGMDAGAKGERRMGVPQVVQADPGQAELLDPSPEVVRQSLRVERSTISEADDQLAVVVEGSQSKPLLQLP